VSGIALLLSDRSVALRESGGVHSLCTLNYPPPPGLRQEEEGSG
jgi:hypothetical protein